MVNFSEAPGVILAMLVIAVIGVATFLALDSIDEQLVSGTLNCNAVNRTGCGEGYNATSSVTTGVGNVFDLAPTWGTLVGVGILLAIVAAFVIVGSVGYGYAKKRGVL